MGTTYQFTCPGCDFKAEVSGRGDAGMLVETETIYCEQCRNLQDCVVGRFGESAVPTAPLPLRCRRSKSHAVRLWNAKEPCPRCGQRRMVAGKGMCEWD